MQKSISSKIRAQFSPSSQRRDGITQSGALERSVGEKEKETGREKRKSRVRDATKERAKSKEKVKEETEINGV